MRKTIIPILLGIFLLSFISAGLNLELEPLGEIYAGETIQRDLIITTTENMLIYLSHDSSEDIELEYISPIQVNKNRIIQLNISTNKYMDSSEQIITIYANAEGEDEVIYQSSSSSGGSSSSSYTPYLIDNVSGKDYGDVSKYPRYNVQDTKEDIVVEDPIEIIIKEEIEKKSKWYFWLSGTLLILLLGYIIFEQKFKKKKVI